RLLGRQLRSECMNTAILEREQELEPMSDSIITVRNMSKKFRTKRSETVALDDVSLSVADGEFVTIAGPSGCGKSTLLKIIAGLTDATEGEVSLFGKPVKGPQKDIGFAFQR